ncbi:hypothetical protein [Pinisolibacter sp.]|uniref:hypothetical protein n=1 Tax=Pinisolibacter sp. TaxID=2172024 RepID=UPI002FDEE015
MRSGTLSSAGLGVAIGLNVVCAHAQDAGLTAPVPDKVILTEARAPSTWAVALYGGVWTNSTLPSFPYNLVRGNLTFEDAQIASLIVDRRLFDFDLDLPGTRWRLNGFSVEAEGTLNQHFGLQDHVEATAAVKLRTGEIGLGSMASMNLAWANGLSYAFAAPKWEYGPTFVHGVDSRHLQYFMAFEAAVTPTAAKNLSAFFRLHHRSGIYGVISPRRTGSNYVGGGLRWTFR